MTALVPAAKLADVPEGALVAVTLPGGDRVCLANVGGELCAFADECSHAAFPLSAGELLDDGTVLCAWHGARFDPHTGAALAGPAPCGVATYEVTIRGDEVLVGRMKSRVERRA